MSTEPAPTTRTTPTRTTPDWALVLLFALLAGALIYSLYYAFASQAAVNRQLAGQNAALLKRLATLEDAQGQSVKASTLNGLKREITQSRATIDTLQARLQTVEKTTSAPAPVIEFSAPAAGNKETLQQFLALKTAVASGQPFARELSLVASLPEVASVQERLKPSATSGVQSETALRDALDTWLEQHPATVTVEDPALEGFNTRLKGLLSIRRKQAVAVDAYAVLRAQVEAGATIDLIITSVRDLDDDARAPLASWLEKATTRQAAIAAVTAAEMALLKPAS